MRGKTASGAFILRKTAQSFTSQDTLVALRKAKTEDKRPLLYSFNEYKKPKLFSDATFRSDVEAQNFYVVDKIGGGDQLQMVKIFPSAKTKMVNFPT